jgi:hypothetical protein
MSIKSNVTKALTHAHAYGDAIEQLKRDCAGKSRDEARAEMLPAVAAFPKYNVKVVDGKLSPESANYETARKALQRLLNDVCGKAEHAKQEPVAVPAKVTKQVKTLVAEVIASGLTKAQFDAVVAELRASISFK